MKSDTELLSRHLLEGQTVEGEMAAIAQQEPAVQTRFWDRLRKLDEYLTRRRPSMAETAELARSLEISTRQLYRLSIKTKELGPVRALIAHGSRRASLKLASQEDRMVLDMVRAALERKPDQRIADVERYVSTQCKKWDVPPPSRTKVYTMVHGLRQAGNAPRDAFIFGASIAVDQAALSWSTEEGEMTCRHCTLIIDRATRLVIGLSLEGEEGGVRGINRALADIRERIGGLLRHHLPVAPHIGEVKWITPPGLEAVELEEIRARAPSGDFSLDVKTQGVRRHGAHVLALLGNRWGRYRIKPRLISSAPVTDFLTRKKAEREIKEWADSWNQNILHTKFVNYWSGDSWEEHVMAYDKIGDELKFILWPCVPGLIVPQVDSGSDDGVDKFGG